MNELCDRLTIAQLKLERLPASEIDKNLLRQQIEYLFEGVDLSNQKLVELIAELKTINGKMWELEHEIRKGLDSELGYAEIGKRAIDTRDCNRERVAIKNKIATLSGQPEFLDCKMNHVSGK